MKVKVYASAEHQPLVQAIEAALKPWLVARGSDDLAEMLLLEWPDSEFEILDLLTGNYVFERLYAAQSAVERRGGKTPALRFSNFDGGTKPGFKISALGEELSVVIRSSLGLREEKMELPYKLPLKSERGRRSAAEWAIWKALSALRARESQS